MGGSVRGEATCTVCPARPIAADGVNYRRGSARLVRANGGVTGSVGDTREGSWASADVGGTNRVGVGPEHSIGDPAQGLAGGTGGGTHRWIFLSCWGADRLSAVGTVAGAFLTDSRLCTPL